MSYTLAVANGDLAINALGSVDLITGRDKVSQDTAEILLSDYDAARDYGGKLQTMVVPGLGAKAIISNEIHRIVKRLQNMQYLDPTITKSERIASIPYLNVTQDNSTDTQFDLKLSTADNGAVLLSDSVRYRPVQISHTWPGGIFPAS